MKKLIYLILSFLSLFQPAQAENNQSNNPPKQTGLTLDIARHFYSADIIKKFIDSIAEAKGNYLHLHLSDDENYAIESTYLDQLEQNATQKEGIFYNNKTNKPFLTYKQINEIIHYAKDRNIELIPEVDSPGHMKAIFTLLRLKHGDEFVKQITSKLEPNELDITNAEAIETIKTLIGEVIYIFGYSAQHFHAGGDEFGYNIENNHEFIQYINTLNDYINSKGLVTRIWNDGLLKNKLNNLNKNIEITYWSFDGDAQEPENIKERRAIRATLPELTQNGFKVLNYNSYYLYFVPTTSDKLAHDVNYASNDIKNNWSLRLWDGNNHKNMATNSQNIIGSSLSVWGENIRDIPTNEIEKRSAILLRTMSEKTREVH